MARFVIIMFVSFPNSHDVNVFQKSVPLNEADVDPKLNRFFWSMKQPFSHHSLYTS